MLRIRLQRRGRKKRPIHHIVVADSRKPRDGRIIEDLGRFDNITPNNQLDLKRDRALHWLKVGAQPTDTVRSIFKNEGLMYQMHLIRWGKTEEEIEEALQEWREKRADKEDKVPTRKEQQQALLDAEEKEFQKQLQKKAEEAAREKAKQEALASEEEEDEDSEEEAQAADEQEASDVEETSQETADETTNADDEASVEEDADAEASEADDEETEEQETEAVQEEVANEDQPQEDVAAEEQEDPEEKPAGEAAEAQDAEAEETETSSDEAKDESSEEDTETSSESDDDTSTGMLAKDAIDHIENSTVEELEGFVTEDEDRVTVRRAWEEKQEG